MNRRGFFARGAAGILGLLGLAGSAKANPDKSGRRIVASRGVFSLNGEVLTFPRLPQIGDPYPYEVGELVRIFGVPTKAFSVNGNHIRFHDI